MNKDETFTNRLAGAELLGGSYGNDVKTLCTPSTYGGSEWKATRFDSDGEPFGHTDYASLQDAVSKEQGWGAKLVRWIYV